MQEGPLLETLTRRLAECPADFLVEPELGGRGAVNVAAVLNDLAHELGSVSLDQAQLKALRRCAAQKERNRLRLMLIGAWLLHDDWFRREGRYGGPAARFLIEELAESAGLTDAGKFITDPDRREELARLCLKALGLRPAGETEAQAQDRLATLNTAERQRVIKAAREAEARAQAIREAMAKQAAEEAADKWSRE
jgi:hypothetical protein